LGPSLQVKEAIRKERHKNQMETRKTLNKLRSGAGATTGTVEKIALNTETVC
jgi:hypothetical protein